LGRKGPMVENMSIQEMTKRRIFSGRTPTNQDRLCDDREEAKVKNREPKGGKKKGQQKRLDKEGIKTQGVVNQPETFFRRTAETRNTKVNCRVRPRGNGGKKRAKTTKRRRRKYNPQKTTAEKKKKH